MEEDDEPLPPPPPPPEDEGDEGDEDPPPPPEPEAEDDEDYDAKWRQIVQVLSQEVLQMEQKLADQRQQVATLEEQMPRYFQRKEQLTVALGENVTEYTEAYDDLLSVQLQQLQTLAASLEAQKRQDGQKQVTQWEEDQVQQQAQAQKDHEETLEGLRDDHDADLQILTQQHEERLFEIIGTTDKLVEQQALTLDPVSPERQQLLDAVAQLDMNKVKLASLAREKSRKLQQVGDELKELLALHAAQEHHQAETLRQRRHHLEVKQREERRNMAREAALLLS